MNSTTKDMFRFDASGKEFIHSTQMVQFFLLVGYIGISFGMVFRFFKMGKFYGDDVIAEEIIIPNQPSPSEAPVNDPKDLNIDFENEIPDQNVNPSPEIRETQPMPKHEKGNLQVFFEIFEEMMFQYLPLASIVLLNMINFGCYISCAFLFMFWIICVFLFNQLKLAKAKFTEAIHYIIIFILFINYFVNDQTTI